MNGKSFDDVMRRLLESEEVRAYMNTVQVRLGLEIAKRRVGAEVTPHDMVVLLDAYDVAITPNQLALMEMGSLDIDGDVYKEVLAVMEEIEDGFTPTEVAELIRRINDPDSESIPVEDVVGKEEWERIKNEPIDEDDGWE